MNSRERVIKAIEFDGPDRVPIDHFWTPGAVRRHGDQLKKILRQFPTDFAFPAFWGVERGTQWSKKGGYRDEWGCVWTGLESVGVYPRCTGHPLADWKCFDTYGFPSPLSDERMKLFDRVEKYIHSEGHEKYIHAVSVRLFHRMCFLRGFANALADLIRRRKKMRILRDRIVEYNLQTIKRWIELDIDAIHIADDWGTQDRLFIRPNLWREFFKPAYKKMIRPARAAGRDVIFHSDGYIEPIIPDLIDCGVNVLNPQLSAMNIDDLGRNFGGKICIQSDLDRQYVLPRGNVDEVTQHVKHVIRAFGIYNGGLIGHGEIGPDVPLENIRAMFSAFERFGKYPLNL